MPAPSLRIGIVGGSIAGCTAAIELSRLGHEVVVYERSKGELVGRGAGIGTPTPIFDKLVDRDLVDPDMPRFNAGKMLLASRSDRSPHLGHAALKLNLDMVLCNWGDLYRNLRKRVPESVYRGGMSVADIRLPEQVGDPVTLDLSDVSRPDFDLVVFCDGYQSLGRRMLLPDVGSTYRGYVLWRGLLPESELDDPSPLEGCLYRIHYKGLPGNAVYYFVPGAGGSIRRGERVVNWACYLPVEKDALQDLLVDRHGRQHAGSLPPGSMRPSEERHFKELMHTHLPSYFGDIIARTANTFVQPIYTVEVPAYFKSGCCLVGDAGSVAPPFTGSGVFKATNNVLDLSAALEGADSLQEALDAWSARQLESANRISLLGRQMERAFVWEAPDFADMDEDTTRTWWNGAITFPDEFRYVEASDGD